MDCPNTLSRAAFYTLSLCNSQGVSSTARPALPLSMGLAANLPRPCLLKGKKHYAQKRYISTGSSSKVTAQVGVGLRVGALSYCFGSRQWSSRLPRRSDRFGQARPVRGFVNAQKLSDNHGRQPAEHAQMRLPGSKHHQQTVKVGYCFFVAHSSRRRIQHSARYYKHSFSRPLH